MLEELRSIFESPLGFWEALVPVAFSLLLSFLVYAMYKIFYSSRHIGAGVNRTFLLGGPAITMLFLVIQTSCRWGWACWGAVIYPLPYSYQRPGGDRLYTAYDSGSIGAATGNYSSPSYFSLLFS
jgi:hypothetical protein